MGKKFSFGVGWRLFGALLLNGAMAVAISLGAYSAFGRLHGQISEVTSRLFPAVVAAAKLERQHQRIMRGMEQLATTSNTLAQQALEQDLSDLSDGYERLLRELDQLGHAKQTASLREKQEEFLRLEAAIDHLVSQKIAAGQALRRAYRDLDEVASALAEPALRDQRTWPVQRWLGQADRVIYLATSVQAVESSYALDKTAAVARAEFGELGKALAAVPAADAGRLDAAEAALAALIDGDGSIFRQRRAELEASERMAGLLERARQTSLLSTGLNSGILVDQTALAEARRQDVIQITDVYERIFFISVGIVLGGLLVTVLYVQKKVLARLWKVQQALSVPSEDAPMDIPVEGRDEISDLARTLAYYVHEVEAKRRDLRLQKERAEKADAAKSEFLATMSHEIRTPLNGILGLGRLLLASTLRKEARRQVEGIMRCGATLLRHVDDVLDLRRIEDGRLELAPVPCILAPMVTDALAAADGPAREKGVRLALDMAPDVPPAVLADPLRLRQVLINLVGNAVKFTDHGTVSVSVRRRDETTGEELVIAIRDQGIGIQQDRLEAIFDKLEQADPTIARRFGGTGLGLAIVRHLLEAMGGRIEVESEVGRGSLFTLHIPLIRADMPQDQALPGGPGENSGRALSLLLVEDDEINREVAAGMIGEAGHRMTIAVCGTDAVRLAQDGAFDAVLLDMRLPDMDGVEVARRIRSLADRSRATVPIIAVTANIFAADQVRYREAGIDSILEKPLFPEDLSRALADVIRGGGAPAAIVDDPWADSVLDEERLERYRRQVGASRFLRFRDILYALAAESIPSLASEYTSADEMAEIAHRLAGAASHFGLVGFIADMQAIETLVRSGKEAEARALAALAAECFDTGRSALDQWGLRMGLTGLVP